MWTETVLGAVNTFSARHAQNTCVQEDGGMQKRSRLILEPQHEPVRSTRGPSFGASHDEKMSAANSAAATPPPAQISSTHSSKISASTLRDIFMVFLQSLIASSFSSGVHVGLPISVLAFSSSMSKKAAASGLPPSFLQLALSWNSWSEEVWNQ